VPSNQQKQTTATTTATPTRKTTAMSLVGYPENQSKMIEFLDALVHSSLHTSSKSIKNHLVQIDNEITRVQVSNYFTIRLAQGPILTNDKIHGLLKTHIQSTIKSSWSDFEHQSITGSSLYHQSIQLENQLNQIDAKLDDPQVSIHYYS
jgi:hypothetical protein